MEALRKIQLYILDEVCNILENNGLDYWLDSGTLLGARRHKGFIPWDDDIDISVHMKDYENIINLLVEKLPNDLQVQDNGLNLMSTELAPIKIFYIPSMIEEELTGRQSHIFIDLFVYSPTKPIFIKSKFKVFLKYLIVSKSKKLSPNLTPMKRIIYNILKSLVTKKQLDNIMKKIRYSQIKSDYLAYDYLCWPAIVYHHKSEIFPLKKMVFENKYYNVPNDVDSFLTKKYGKNFMELPPIEKRKGTHIVRYEITKFPNEK